jgi:SNF family Na+-dependent transporter
MGIQGAVLEQSVEVILVMCLLPTLISVRNYFHGHLMVRRRTSGMALGGILRVLGIYAIAQTLYAFGKLDHITATFALLLGFVIETIVVALAVRALDPKTPRSGSQIPG